MASRIAVIVCFLLVLGLPFVARRPSTARDDAAARATNAKLIVVTPHIEQIRYEFAIAFERWHTRVHGEPATIDWRTPGGTSEIVNQLRAQFAAAAKSGRFRVEDGQPVCEPGTIGYDVFFGGGSYEHGKVAKGIVAQLPGSGRRVTIPMSTPAGFDREQLHAWYGTNHIGSPSQPLYDPDQHWLGTALSGFGIVFNRDVLSRLGLPEPEAFRDLTDPRYANLLALADPRMSGSVTTTYDSILNKQGWDEGWRTLRELCANARYFASSSTRPPIDVSQGEAAAGLAIDFYGRGQAQVVMRPGESPGASRVGYVDPKGAVFIDPDPVSILRGGPNPDLARRFVEFLLTEQAQALWQMPARGNPRAADNPSGPGGEPLGPVRYELRRMPVRRDMYRQYQRYFIDDVNPFELASETPSRGWRSAIAPLMSAFGIDVTDDLQRAWAALHHARADPAFPPDRLEQMERAFYAMPTHTLADGATVPLDEEHYKAIKSDTNGWRDPQRGHRALIAYARFFRKNYRRVVELGDAR